MKGLQLLSTLLVLFLTVRSKIVNKQVLKAREAIRLTKIELDEKRSKLAELETGFINDMNVDLKELDKAFQEEQEMWTIFR